MIRRKWIKNPVQCDPWAFKGDWPGFGAGGHEHRIQAVSAAIIHVETGPFQRKSTIQQQPQQIIDSPDRIII
ncbi:hypothetical protein TcasGA2_TC014331 [Tribolium castaneum]|uniref:Uncharacterized protein n=1 Tax=Tribolium castaneum TaxID=7070 RepID=D6WLD4_TRICA|nr:hypothetical protein TcasGA2_TC014331 [Tribolium castaneum]